MKPNFLPVDEHAWQADVLPAAEAPSTRPQESAVAVEAKLFRRQHQFLFKLLPQSSAMTLPAYVRVSRDDPAAGYAVEFRSTVPDTEAGNTELTRSFRSEAILEKMRKADSPQAALSELRQFFRDKGIDLMRVQS